MILQLNSEGMLFFYILRKPITQLAVCLVKLFMQFLTLFLISSLMLWKSCMASSSCFLNSCSIANMTSIVSAHSALCFSINAQLKRKNVVWIRQLKVWPDSGHTVQRRTRLSHTATQTGTVPPVKRFETAAILNDTFQYFTVKKL